MYVHTYPILSNTCIPFPHLSLIQNTYSITPPPKKKKTNKTRKNHLNLYFIHQPISSQNVVLNNEAKCWYFNNYRNSVSTLEVGLPFTLSGEFPPVEQRQYSQTLLFCTLFIYSPHCYEVGPNYLGYIYVFSSLQFCTFCLQHSGVSLYFHS